MTNTEWENLNEDQREQALVDAGMSEDDVYKVVGCDLYELEDYMPYHYNTEQIIENVGDLEYYDYAD